jgi:hypothetical protein
LSATWSTTAIRADDAETIVVRRAQGVREALVRRRLTRPEVNGLDVVDWGARSVQITEPGGPGERDALRDELAAFVLMQRATFATPVSLNAGLSERPLTLLDRSFPA